MPWAPSGHLIRPPLRMHSSARYRDMLATNRESTTITEKTNLHYNLTRLRVFFSRASLLSCNSARMNKSTLPLRKSCSLHMTVFEIVVHCNVDNWTKSLAYCFSAQIISDMYHLIMYIAA